jgi:hypothetical protein
MPPTATSPPTPRWCSPSRPGAAPRPGPGAGQAPGRRPRHRHGGGRGAGLREPHARCRFLAQAVEIGDRTGARLWPLEPRRRAQGQCRIRLGQPHRPAACRPLPRRGLRRCAGQPSQPDRLRRHPRVLPQRRRRPGRRPRPLGLPALLRGAGRRHRRDPLGALSGRVSQAGRRGAGASARQQAAGPARVGVAGDWCATRPSP